MPQRIQRKRTKGWRMPKNTVYVGRPSRWGNPVRVGSVRAYSHHLEKTSEGSVGHFDPSEWNSPQDAVWWYAANLEEQMELGKVDLRPLRGKTLACWCRLDQPCHADVLLKMANK